MKHRYSFSGFTLVELLCSVALVGVLSAGLVLLVSRTLEGQIQVQEAFCLERDVARGFAWMARDVESALLPLSGESWFDLGEGGAFEGFSFSRWGSLGREDITYAIIDGNLVRTSMPFEEESVPRISNVCASVAALKAEPRGQGVAITLTLAQKNGGQSSFTRVLAPIAEN